MKESPARRKFKKHFGNANHLMITSIVALHNLEKTEYEKAPEELRTAWNPRNKTNSIKRSRIFIQKSFLAWAVDSIDMYISLLDRKPSLIQDEKISSEFQKKSNSRSVNRRARIINSNFSLSPYLYPLIDVLITWRNNIFHEATDNKLHDNTRSKLKKYEKEISENYRGLIIEDLADKAEKSKSLTFKETASLINATHHFVQEIDEIIISKMNKSKYCCDAVDKAFNSRNDVSFKIKYKQLEEERRKQFIINWLRNKYGATNISLEDVVEASRLYANN